MYSTCKSGIKIGLIQYMTKRYKRDIQKDIKYLCIQTMKP